MIREGRGGLLAALALLLAGATGARGDELEAAHREALAANPPEVSCTLVAPRRRYQLGEPVELELRFASKREGLRLCEPTSPHRGAGAGISVVASGAACSDPGQRVSAGAGFSSDLRQTDPLDGAVRRRVVTEWVRFDRPGTYRLYLRLEGWLQDQGGGAPPALTTSMVQLELVPLDPAFERRALERCEAALRSEDEEQRRDAIRALGCLGTAGALDRLLRRLHPDDLQYAGLALALASVRDPAVLREGLARAVEAPDVPWDWDLLTVWLETQLPPFPELGPSPSDEESVAFDLACERQERARRDLLARLGAALPKKQGTARLVTAALIGESLERTPDPELPGAAAREAVAAAFAAAPPDQQDRLLRRAWHAVRAPAFAPALRKLAAGSDGLAVEALLRLSELDPEPVAARVLADWRGERKLPARALLALPPGALQLDAELEAWLADPAYPQGYVLNQLIERHGGRRLLPRVKARLERSPDPPLVRFWVGQDPLAALDGLGRLMTTLHGYDRLLLEAADEALGPRRPAPVQARIDALVLSRLRANPAPDPYAALALARWDRARALEVLRRDDLSRGGRGALICQLGAQVLSDAELAELRPLLRSDGERASLAQLQRYFRLRRAAER
ncbi:MAG: hypothetical protein AB7N76_10740 [Planctomycetota bacterium]